MIQIIHNIEFNNSILSDLGLENEKSVSAESDSERK